MPPADVEEGCVVGRRAEGQFDLGVVSIFHASDFAGGGRTKTVQPSKKFYKVIGGKRTLVLD